MIPQLGAAGNMLDSLGIKRSWLENGQVVLCQLFEGWQSTPGILTCRFDWTCTTPRHYFASLRHTFGNEEAEIACLVRMLEFNVWPVLSTPTDMRERTSCRRMLAVQKTWPHGSWLVQLR